MSGLHHLRRVVAREVWRLVGPAECAEWPEAAAEPGVKDVALLLQRVRLGAAGAAADWSLFAIGHGDVPVGAVPGGDAVPPPELSAHVPIANLGEPVLPRLLKVRRNNLCCT